MLCTDAEEAEMTFLKGQGLERSHWSIGGGVSAVWRLARRGSAFFRLIFRLFYFIFWW